MRMAIHPDARISNALGDCVLGVSHIYALLYILRRRRQFRRKRLMFCLVSIYLATLLSFQLIGAYFHLYAPIPSEANLLWLIYLGAGCVSAMFYGAALSLDVLKSKIAVCAWLSFAFIYSLLIAPMCLDLAQYFTFLPRTFSMELPAGIAGQLSHMPWMPSALAVNQQKISGLKPLTLTFDGRGYAAIPFKHVFDAKYTHTFDLVAAFPCFRTDSLPFLMLCVGVIANTFHLTICIANRKHHPRARTNIAAHFIMFLALLTMPVAMFFGGVALGIDWMHTCAAPSMFLQAQSCYWALVDDDENENENDSHSRRSSLATDRPSLHPATPINKKDCISTQSSSLLDTNTLETPETKKYVTNLRRRPHTSNPRLLTTSDLKSAYTLQDENKYVAVIASSTGSSTAVTYY